MKDKTERNMREKSKQSASNSPTKARRPQQRSQPQTSLETSKEFKVQMRKNADKIEELVKGKLKAAMLKLGGK